MSGTVTTGWHSDPFGIHEARYFSADGQPTKLVRDRGIESYDEPPSAADEVAAAMARMSAMPEPPSAYPPRDAYRHERAPERDPRRPSVVGFAVTGIIGIAAAVAFVLVALTILHPKSAGTSDSPSTPGGMTDIAFVTQAATRTLQQHTADVVMSASTAGGTNTTMQGTGAFDLGGKAGTLNMAFGSKVSSVAFREIFVDGYIYLGVSVDGRSLLPAGKTWIAEQAPATQGAGIADLAGGSLTATLASLENQGISVRALGTKDIGGVSCTGYAVTPPGTQDTVVTVWINPQNLVRELSMNATFGLSADLSTGGASPSASPLGTSSAVSLDLTMDFTYSAAPLQVTAPPAASTISFGAWLQQLGTTPALNQLQLGSFFS